jgi:hypothetical protein
MYTNFKKWNITDTAREFYAEKAVVWPDFIMSFFHIYLKFDSMMCDKF